MSNNSSPDFSTVSDDQESKPFNDTIFGTLKKKTLNDYDKELKSLKEENFNLKLRIYMLEEENVHLNEKLAETNCKRRHVSSAVLNSTRDEEDQKLNEKFSSSLSDVEATLVNESFDSWSSKNIRRSFSSENEQKDSETEALNEINQQLEEKIEKLEKELQYKENQIEEIKKKNENLAEQFELFKLSLERELYEKFSHKLEIELNGKLNEAYQDFYLKEKAFQNEINGLKNLVDQRNKGIDIFKQYNSDSLIKNKTTDVQKIDNLMEELKEKENKIKQLEEKFRNFYSCSRFDKQISHKTQLVARINKPSKSKWFYSCVYLKID